MHRFFGRLLTARKLAAVLCAGLLLWLGSSGLVAWQLVHRQAAPFAEPPSSVVGAELESLRLATADGESIGAWLVRSTNAQGVVLVLHGNGGSRSSCREVTQLVAENGWSVLAISLRCHGDSTGEINDFGYSARHDVVAAVEFLQHEFPGQPVFVVGRSLGAAAAIFAAGDLDDRVAGYFLEQPYKDLSTATWNRLQHRLPTGLDAVAYAGLNLWSVALLPAESRQASPYEAVAKIPSSVPVTFVSGSDDRRAPFADVRLFHERIESHSQLVEFVGASHQPLVRHNPKLYRRSLLALLHP